LLQINFYKEKEVIVNHELGLANQKGAMIGFQIWLFSMNRKQLQGPIPINVPKGFWTKALWLLGIKIDP